MAGVYAKTTDEFLQHLKPRDFLASSIAAGQPRSLLHRLHELSAVQRMTLFSGLLAAPYPCLTQPQFYTVSGYYGPVERMLNEAGYNVAYLPLPFQGFEKYLEWSPPRVVMTTLSSADAQGYLSFGTNCEAVYRPFVAAARDPRRLAVAEVNARMPQIKGLPEWGDNRIHVDELDLFVESDEPLLELPAEEPSEVEKRIAEHIVPMLQDGDTLQFGIGGIPNALARTLAASDKKNFGLHSEFISDGFLTLLESGKLTNQKKGLHPGLSVFTFALGSRRLYEFLDERNGHNQGRVVAAPVSYVNDPAVIAQNPHMVSINAGFMIDLAGQVCSESIGFRQYSGVGGQLSFVEGAFYSAGGRSVICIKSTVEREGRRESNIVAQLPPGAVVSTPRHCVQFVVTEYGVADLFGLSDEERPFALIDIAHPDFRESLQREARERNRLYYHARFD